MTDLVGIIFISMMVSAAEPRETLKSTGPLSALASGLIVTSATGRSEGGLLKQDL